MSWQLLEPWALRLRPTVNRQEETMGVICHHTMSLDGYVAGPDDSIEWAFVFGEPTSLADETMKRIGAILAGRRWYDLAIERWDGVEGIYHGAYEGPVFVLTHRPPQESTSPRITFISDGIERAVATAQAAARDKDVGIFGPTLSRQCLQAGLLDEIVIHLAPVLLGDGIRLYGGAGDRQVDLERLSLGEGQQLTDLHFRVVQKPPRPQG
jgi:dihydrofolate reductase